MWNDEWGGEFVCDLLLPPLHLGEIHSHQSVGHGLLIQVTTVSSDEGWHVVTWERKQEERVGYSLCYVTQLQMMLFNNVHSLYIYCLLCIFAEAFEPSYQPHCNHMRILSLGCLTLNVNLMSFQRTLLTWCFTNKLKSNHPVNYHRRAFGESKVRLCALPCRAPLSRKLFRLNSVFLEARYWMKRCNKKKKKKF